MISAPKPATASAKPARRNRRSLAPVGLDVLTVLARHPDGIGISDIARSVDLEVAQAHRAVRELVSSGWVAQASPNGSYRLTGALLGLAADQLRHTDLRSVAVPVMRRLKQKTGETIVLAEFRAGQLVCIARELSDAPVVAWTQLGDSWALGSPAAVAIAVEASIFGSRQSELLPEGYRISDERVSELEGALAQGWSLDDARYRQGGYAVGASILNLEGRPLGALAIGWPSDRSDPGRVSELGALVRTAAAEVSTQLGAWTTDASSPWRAVAEERQADLFRHLADLRLKTYEGAAGREAQLAQYHLACDLLSPVVEMILGYVSERLLDGKGRVERREAASDEEGSSVTWSLVWPDQEAAMNKHDGVPLAPVSVVGRLRPFHLHGHLGGSYFGDWPMQIRTPADARRQAPVVLSIVEAELHQRVFEGGGNWRLIPAFCEQVGEATVTGLARERGGDA